MTHLKDYFLLDPGVIYLNHGSFGATPKPVFDVYQEWQRRLEWEPVHFIDKQLPALLQDARRVLGEYLNADADDLVYIPNATFGVNVVGRSLQLGPGDEVLASDQEYGACDNIWNFLSRKRGFRYIHQPISLPTSSQNEIVEQFWEGVTERTRLIFLSHITSTTALRLPVEAICARARQAGILTLIDGAHAPGQIPLDLAAVGADFYTGNAHKWLCAPKGSAFLHTRRERQPLIEPLVVGWGWGEERIFSYGSNYLDYQQWLGTNDISAYLSVPTAIQFQADHGWPAVRQACHQLVAQALHRICDLTGLPPLYPDEGGFYVQMAIAPLPPIEDLRAFKDNLYQDYRIEIPCTEWRDLQFIRVSIQGYNTQEDVNTLVQSLRDLLSAKASLH